MANQAYELITDKILASLESGTVPWHKPWSAGLPRNATTNRPYHGINVALLSMAPYSDPRWLTYKQSVQLGGHVRKGEHGSLITFWKQLKVRHRAVERAVLPDDPVQGEHDGAPHVA